MDPVGSAQAVLVVCIAIYEQAQMVQCNKKQSLRLAARTKLVGDMIKGLMHTLPTSMQVAHLVEQQKKVAIPAAKKAEASSHPGSEPLQKVQVYAAALVSLNQTLNSALLLVQSFAKAEWAIKVLRAQAHSSKFDDIYRRIDQDMSQLNLGLNVHQILNKEEDEKDRQADVAALMAKQDEILQLVAEDKKETQRLALDEENRHLVLMQQMASMRFFLQERLQPQKKEKPPISKKLLVPFYDLSIDTLLVKGSFGNIYHGRWLQQEVAIKMIEGELTEAERKEFIREVRIMKELRSKHVMTLYAVCDEPGRACLVMEYMEQGSLRSLLDRGALPDDEDKHRLIIEVALGLHYLHSQDILHRDFKSANVLIDKFGAARIADFGLSKLTSKEMTTLGKKTDDIQWSAPEIIQSTGDNHAFSEASDVYSFGVVMWEILTGKKPYADLPLAEVAQKLMKGEHEAIPPTLPKVYQSLLKACWSEDRHSRPSMAQVIEQLRAFVPAPKDKEEIGASIMFAPSTVGAQAGFWPKPRERGGAGASSSSQSASPAVEPETYYMAGFGYEQEKSMEKAVAHYQKAASMGYPRAKTALAMHYMQGTGGLSVDKQKAHALLKEAAEGGHARGMRALAYQYEKGDGMPVDMEAAQRWYQKAADAGDEYAKDKLSRLQKGRGFQKA